MNSFQSKALADKKSNTFSLTLELPWPSDDSDLVYALTLDMKNQVELMSI